MPTIPVARDATAPNTGVDSLAPRLVAPESADLNARQPAVQAAPNVAVTLDALTERAAIGRRDGFNGIIPTYYNFNGPSPGTVVGLVLGSVAGFLLVCWLLYSLTMLGGTTGGRAIAGEEEIVVRRRRGSDSRRSRRSTRTEVREFSRSPRRREQIIVEERRGPPPRPRSVVVEERVRVPGDDIVEVIEEHEEYRTRRGGGGGGRRSGGYSGY